MIDSKSFSIRLEQHLIKIYSEVKTTKEIKQLSDDLLKFVESKVNNKPTKVLNSLSKFPLKNETILGSDRVITVFDCASIAYSRAAMLTANVSSDVTKYPSMRRYSDSVITSLLISLTKRAQMV